MADNDAERAAVDKAYAAKLEAVCTQLLTVLMTAEGADEIESAERRFQSGLGKARQARDRALELLAKPAA